MKLPQSSLFAKTLLNSQSSLRDVTAISKILETKWYKQFKRLFSCFAKSSLGRDTGKHGIPEQWSNFYYWK